MRWLQALRKALCVARAVLQTDDDGLGLAVLGDRVRHGVGIERLDRNEDDIGAAQGLRRIARHVQEVGRHMPVQAAKV